MASHELTWEGDKLCRKGKPLVRIEPDSTYPGMWRVRLPDGGLSDLANRTRAKDAAMSIALRATNASAPKIQGQETPREARQRDETRKAA